MVVVDVREEVNDEGREEGKLKSTS